MRVLENLQPKAVFHFFEELCQIPHGSANTKAISDYCVRFAKARELEWRQDTANNVVIKKPATTGYEGAPTVILQGHLDMVAVKEPDSPIDFLKDPLDLQIDGDSVYAKGTSLGGDDGIAVAMALAILDSDKLAHPALEVLLTTDEETGMLGAAALDASDLKGRLLLNIDSEDEGILTVSCAGGLKTTSHIPVASAPNALAAYTLRVDGLTGGHSGTEVDKGRANSNLLMGRVLRALADALPLRLVSLSGGEKDNAIAKETTATIALGQAQPDVASQIADAMTAAFRREYASADPDITVTLQPASPAEEALTADATEAVIRYLLLVPNGIAAMSAEIPGLAQTSSNLGVIRLADGELRATSSIRSSVSTQKQMLLERIQTLAALLGGSVSCTGDYPAWEYQKDSALRDIMVAVYTEQYGQPPRVEAIHAGLECGLLSSKLPGLDAVSFGPNLTDIHTTRERMSIRSVQRVWDYTVEILRRLN